MLPHTAIAKTIFNRTLSLTLHCRLGNNNITAAGAGQLAEGLRFNRSLQFLGWEADYPISLRITKLFFYCFITML